VKPSWRRFKALVDFWAASHRPLAITFDPAELTRLWQAGHPPLAVDGIFGARTAASIDAELDPIEKCWPLRLLADGRQPIITSGFKSENPSRPTHNGADMFYRWLDSDPDVPVGDGGAIMRGGKRRWWIPPGTCAIAPAAGVVMASSRIGTGWRVWIDHGNGERSGFMHGKADCQLVKVGDAVELGQGVIVVGDNPRARDATHLHFEISPVDVYRPVNPRPWLVGARYLRTP
jgi:murein DD-endopeptidase MepM/ murein hydrolase activator NlpD